MIREEINIAEAKTIFRELINRVFIVSRRL